MKNSDKILKFSENVFPPKENFVKTLGRVLSKYEFTCYTNQTLLRLKYDVETVVAEFLKYDVSKISVREEFKETFLLYEYTFFVTLGLPPSIVLLPTHDFLPRLHFSWVKGVFVPLSFCFPESLNK